MRIRKIVLLIILLLTLINPIGCWNRRELDTLAIVSGAGIDKGKEPGKINIITQIIKAGEIKTPGGGSGGEDPFWNLKGTGTTDFQTIRNMTFESSRKLFWPHSEVLVFGEEIAKEGLYTVIDFFARDPEMRRTTWILIAKGKASEILEAKPGVEKIPAMDISKLVEGRKSTSQIAGVNLHEFMTRLMSKTTAPVATLVELTKNGDPILTGTAVFKKDKLVGILNKTETRGLLWVLGEVNSGIIVVDGPSGNGKVSLEIIRASNKIIPEIKNDKIHIKVEIKEEGHLGSQATSEDLTELSAFKSLEKLKSKEIENEIMSAVRKAQELNTDIFGFGDAVHRKYPKVWKEIEGEWDDYFPEIEVTLAVEAKLRRVGMTTKPVRPE